MLTPEQLAFYDTFGFLKFKQLFTPKETAEISRLMDEVLTEHRFGKEFDTGKRQEVLGFVEHREGLARLVEDDRIYPIAEDLLGPDFVWITSDGNLYVGDTQWHPDSDWPDQTFRSIKFAFYMDPVRQDTGCLRVIPGSHKEPFRSDLRPIRVHRDYQNRLMRGESVETLGPPPPLPFGMTGDQLPGYPLESDPGDVVLFNHRTWHSSFGGKTGRRMFTLNFTEKPRTEEQVGYHRKLYEGHLKRQSIYLYGAKDRVYQATFLTGGGPRRQTMVKPLLDWGFK